MIMEKYIIDKRTGLKNELAGDYYLPAGEDEPMEEQIHIGIWEQRHHEYFHRNKRVFLCGLQLSGKIYEYLADIDRQAEEIFAKLVKDLAENEGVTEALKAENQMLWVQKMCSIRNRATEIVNAELNYTK